jgi:hypothetical protein
MIDTNERQTCAEFLMAEFNRTYSELAQSAEG